MDPERILVIGGGIGGLAAAYRLQERAQARQRTAQITLVERSESWGGVTRSSTREGCLLEHGPDSIIRIKPAGLQLIRDLGLEERIQDTNPACRAAYILRGKRLLRVPDGLYLMAPSRYLPFALSPIISWPGKLRMGLDLVLPRRDPGLGEESLADFVRRRLGREALERLAQPMVSGIYTADPERLSVGLAMPQFPEMEREHRSLILAMRANRKRQRKAGAGGGGTAGPRYGLFLSLEGGLQTLVDTLVAHLDGSELRLQTTVEQVQAQAAGYRVRYADGREESYDRVVSCVPAHAAATALRPVDAALAGELAAMEYASVATVNVAFPAGAVSLPPGAGFVVPAVERRQIIAATFSSQKYLGRCPEDLVLLRAFVGGGLQPEQLEGGEDAIRARAVGELQAICDIQAEPVFTQVHHWPHSMAQPVVGLADRLQRIRDRVAEHPGLHVIGSGFDGVGIPDIIAQADRIAEAVFPE